MSMTPRLSLPLLAPGQAQKELFHNESLQALDALVAAAVDQPPSSTPADSPAVGSLFIVGTNPNGDWTGHANHLASFTQGGWRFIEPVDGMSAFVRSSGATAVFRDGTWEIGQLVGSEVTIGGKKVLGARGPAVATPTGGGTIDAEARAALSQILAAMREHGLIEI